MARQVSSRWWALKAASGKGIPGWGSGLRKAQRQERVCCSSPKLTPPPLQILKSLKTQPSLYSVHEALSEITGPLLSLPWEFIYRSFLLGKHSTTEKKNTGLETEQICFQTSTSLTNNTWVSWPFQTWSIYKTRPLQILSGFPEKMYRVFLNRVSSQ